MNLSPNSVAHFNQLSVINKTFICIYLIKKVEQTQYFSKEDKKKFIEGKRI